MKKNKYAIQVKDIDKSFTLNKGEDINSVKTLFTKPWALFRSNTEKFNALSDITFDVEKGDFIGIIGRNGSGKSTLLKILAGIYKQDRGEVIVNGKMVPFLELGVGFNPDLSARENIYLNGTILGMSKKFLDKKFDEIVEFAEVEKFIDTPIKNFSSGMMLKLAFAIAIQSDAEIFLLDEILAVGDAVFQRKSAKMIKEFIYRGKTILYVSHNLAAVEEYANKVLWIDKGRIKFFGDGEKGVKLYSEYTFQVEKSIIAKELKQGSNLKIGTLKVEAVKAKVVVLENGDIKVTAWLKHNKPIKTLNVAFGLYTRKDENLFSVSTQMDKIKLPSDLDKISIIFKNPNLLPGQYYVNIAVFGREEEKPYHWQKEIATFKIYISDRVNPFYRGGVFFDHKWLK